MTRTRTTGQTGVGDLRLAPIDVGFDLRAAGTPIHVPAHFASVSLDVDGDTYLVEGAREDMIAAIRAAGYRIAGMD